MNLTYTWLFYQFMTMYNKNYTESIYNERFPIFSKNLDYIFTANQNNNNSFQLGINAFADLTPREFSLRMGLRREKPKQSTSCGDFIPSNGLIPSAFDWRNQNVITEVKDQGSCGSCWAFASTEVAESAFAIKNGTDPPILAPQQLVDCLGYGAGCSGGPIDLTLEYIIHNGLETEANYPYMGEDGHCAAVESFSIPYKLDQCFDVPSNNELLLKQALLRAPLVVCIEADEYIFQFYESGIISSYNCGTELDHAVQLVGYGEEKGQKYWIVRNSWGTNWGEQGYFRLERYDSEYSEGTCGIAMMASGAV